MKKKYITPNIKIIPTDPEELLTTSAWHDHGQGAYNGNPDKGGWKPKFHSDDEYLDN